MSSTSRPVSAAQLLSCPKAKLPFLLGTGWQPLQPVQASFCLELNNKLFGSRIEGRSLQLVLQLPIPHQCKVEQEASRALEVLPGAAAAVQSVYAPVQSQLSCAATLSLHGAACSSGCHQH